MNIGYSNVKSRIDDLVIRMPRGKLLGPSEYTKDREDYKFKIVDAQRLEVVNEVSHMFLVESFAKRVYDSLIGGEPLGFEEGVVFQGAERCFLAIPGDRDDYALALKIKRRS